MGSEQHLSNLTVCPSASAWLRARPGSFTSATSGPRSSTGSSRGTQGGEFRLRIENTDTSREVAEATEQIQDVAALARARLGRRRHLPARPRSSVRRRWRAGSSRRARRTRTRARSASACPTRASPPGTTLVRGRVEFPNEQLEDLVLVRSDGRPTYNFASPLEDVLGRDHARHPRRRPHLEHAEADQHPPRARRRAAALRARAARRSAPTARSSRSGTARSRSTSSGMPATTRRALAELPRAARLELRRQDDDHVARRVGRALHARPRRPSPATFDYEKLDWLNGMYLRALSPDEYADALVTYLRERGLRLGRGAGPARRAARAGEDRALRRVPGLRRLPLPRRVEPDRALLDGAVAVVAAARDELAGRRAVRRRGDRERRSAGSPSGSSSRRARRSSRSASRSPARRSRRASSRASSSSARTRRCRRLSAAAGAAQAA